MVVLVRVNESNITYQEAMKSKESKQWEHEKKDDCKSSLMKNRIWTLVDVDWNFDEKLDDKKWVFKVKYANDGSLERYKAILVECAVFAYETIFSDVVKYTYIGFALAVVTTEEIILW